MNGGRSLAAWAGAIARAAASAAPARPARSISAKFPFILWRLPVLEGHISHKRFESPLISQSHFEDNPSKQRDEYCDHSTRIQLKLKLLQFESNAGVNLPTPAGRRSCWTGALTVNARCLALAARSRQTTGLTRERSVADAARAGPWHLPLGDLPFRETQGLHCGAIVKGARLPECAWQPM